MSYSIPCLANVNRMQKKENQKNSHYYKDHRHLRENIYKYTTRAMVDTGRPQNVLQIPRVLQWKIQDFKDKLRRYYSTPYRVEERHKQRKDEVGITFETDDFRQAINGLNAIISAKLTRKAVAMLGFDVGEEQYDVYSEGDYDSSSNGDSDEEQKHHQLQKTEQVYKNSQQETITITKSDSTESNNEHAPQH